MTSENSYFFKNLFDKYNEEIPILLKKKCIKCGECADEDVCQEKAVLFFPQKYPKFNLKLCNSCFRCIEFCNYNAIIRGKSLKKLIL